MARPDRTHKKTKVTAKAEEKRINKQKDVVIFSINGTNLQIQDNANMSNKSNKSNDLDIEALKAEIYTQIKKQVLVELQRAEHVKEVTERESIKHAASVTKSEINLSGEKTYKFFADNNGLTIAQKDDTLLTFNKSGGIGFSTSIPRTNGKGSVHIQAGEGNGINPPTSGDFTTKGLLVDSDILHKNTLAMRVISKGNRQGFNITGDGNLVLGIHSDKTESKFTVYQNNNDKNSMHVYAPSRYYNANMLDLETAAPGTELYNFIEAKSQTATNGNEFNHVAFKVDGNGSTYTDNTFVSNGQGYAEMFEWEDGNNRNEDRLGFTVTITSTGQIRPASEGDVLLGVVVNTTPAILGNAAWNNWHNKFHKDLTDRRKKHHYQVMEWEHPDNTVESYYNSSQGTNFEIPEYALTYETDPLGKDMYADKVNEEYDYSKPYIPRIKRNWATVLIIGKCLLFKGQEVSKNWIKLRDCSDELEQWFLK